MATDMETRFLGRQSPAPPIVRHELTTAETTSEDSITINPRGDIRAIMVTVTVTASAGVWAAADGAKISDAVHLDFVDSGGAPLWRTRGRQAEYAANLLDLHGSDVDSGTPPAGGGTKRWVRPIVLPVDERLLPGIMTIGFAGIGELYKTVPNGGTCTVSVRVAVIWRRPVGVTRRVTVTRPRIAVGDVLLSQDLTRKPTDVVVITALVPTKTGTRLMDSRISAVRMLVQGVNLLEGVEPRQMEALDEMVRRDGHQDGVIIPRHRPVQPDESLELHATFTSAASADLIAITEDIGRPQDLEESEA